MLLAENKYKNLKQVGEWGNLSKAEAEIVALNPKIEVLKHKGMKKPEGKSRKEEKKWQDKNKKEKKKPEKKKTDFHWQKPRANQMKRMVDGKDYYWCPNHQNKLTKEWGQWVWHKPEDCNNKQQKQSHKNTDTDAQATTTTSLQPNANLAAFDTIDSNTELWCCQVLSRAWTLDVMAWSTTLSWWLLGDVALMAATLIIMVNLLFLVWLMYYEQN